MSLSSFYMQCYSLTGITHILNITLCKLVQWRCRFRRARFGFFLDAQVRFLDVRMLLSSFLLLFNEDELWMKHIIS
jgi:hypothetical protein